MACALQARLSLDPVTTHTSCQATISQLIPPGSTPACQSGVVAVVRDPHTDRGHATGTNLLAQRLEHLVTLFGHGHGN